MTVYGKRVRKSKRGRDGTLFVAIPLLMLDAPRYAALSSSARALLIALAPKHA